MKKRLKSENKKTENDQPLLYYSAQGKSPQSGPHLYLFEGKILSRFKTS
jgi:hypothetical protein